MGWNTEAMRELLSAAFSDEEITTLCFDHFRAVYEDFSVGMSKSAKIQRLVEYCDRHNQMGALANQVQARNPTQYERIASDLRRGSLKGDKNGPPSSEPFRLDDILSIHPENDGRPHQPGGGAQWFSRLEIEAKLTISGCWGKVHRLRRLNDPDDQTGEHLPQFVASRLSWAKNNGLFASISIRPSDTVYLDLAWHAHGDPPFRPDELRVASALDEGARDTRNWGRRQDFIPLEPGFYLFEIQIWAEGYNTPVERTYHLHWPGPGQEDNIRLVEARDASRIRGQVVSPVSKVLFPDPIRNRWALLVGINRYIDPAFPPLILRQRCASIGTGAQITRLYRRDAARRCSRRAVAPHAGKR